MGNVKMVNVPFSHCPLYTLSIKISIWRGIQKVNRVGMKLSDQPVAC